MSGKSGNKKMTKVLKIQEKMGVLEKKVMKIQEIWYKNAVNKKVYHH